MGEYLSKHLERSVPICARGSTGTATLRRYEGRSRRKFYYFRVVLSEAGEAAGEPDAGGHDEGDRVAVNLVGVAPQVNISNQPRVGGGNQEEW